MTTAKADTRLLLLAGDLTTDASQRETDLTAADLGSYEDASARTALDGLGDGRTIEVVCELDNTSSGILVSSGGIGGGSPTYRIVVSAGVVVFFVGITLIGSITPPGLGGSLDDYLIAWATEPDATEAADARSEFVVWSLSSGNVQRLVVLHAVEPADPTDALSVGGLWTGGGSLSSDFTDTITELRISSRFHTAVETREDFISSTAAPDVDGWIVAELPRLPAALVEVAAVAGPQWQAAAAAAVQHRPRLASAIVQALARAPWAELGSDIASTYPAKWVVQIGDSWQATIAWLWWVEVPAACGWLVPWVQVALWSNDTDPPAQLELRVVTSDRKPGQGGQRTTSTITRSTDDGSGGVGALLQLPRVLVRRDKTGRSWVWLETRLTGANAADTSYIIRQVSLLPESVPSYDDPDEPQEMLG